MFFPGFNSATLGFLVRTVTNRYAREPQDRMALAALAELNEERLCMEECTAVRLFTVLRISAGRSCSGWPATGFSHPEPPIPCNPRRFRLDSAKMPAGLEHLLRPSDG